VAAAELEPTQAEPPPLPLPGSSANGPPPPLAGKCKQPVILHNYASPQTAMNNRFCRDERSLAGESRTEREHLRAGAAP
jgi:hypothetical protein